MREKHLFPIREIAAAALLMAGVTAAQSATLGLYVSGPDAYTTSNSEINGLTGPETFENDSTGAASGTVTRTYSNGESGSISAGDFLVTKGANGAGVTLRKAGTYGGGPGSDDQYLSIEGTDNIFELIPAEGTKYLGFWWSAGSGGNVVKLFDKDNNLIATLDTLLLTTFLPNDSTTRNTLGGGTVTTSAYYGKPIAPSQNGASGEAYAYVHLVLTDSDVGIKKVEFSTTDSGFELDNIATSTAEIPSADLPDSFVSVTNVTAEDQTVYAWSTDATATATAVGTGNLDPVTFTTPNTTSTVGGPGTVSLSGTNLLTLNLTDTAKTNGQDSFQYRASLQNGFYATGNVTVLIATLVDDSNSTAFETGTSGNVITGTGNDNLPTGYTLTAVSNGTSTNGGTYALGTDGGYAYTPATGFSGTDTFTYEVCAPDSIPAVPPNCKEATVTILVGPDAVDDGPIVSAINPSTSLPSTVTGNVTSDNGNGTDTVPATSGPTAAQTSYAVVGTPPATDGTLTITPTTGAFEYIPPTDFSGVKTFTYSITVGTGSGAQQDTAEISFAIAPQANGGTGTTTVGTPITVGLPNDVWPVNPVLTSTPSINGGTVSFDSNGVATYTPAPGFGGIDIVEYQVCLPAPNDGVCDTSTITVTVAPTAADKSITGTPNTPIGGNLTPENPSAPIGSTYEVVTPPANGNVTLNPDGSFVYMPNTSWEGDDSFTYRICTGTVCSTPATVSIKVSSGQIANVPTMSVGGLLAMSGLLGGMAAFVRRRKKSN